MFKKTESIHIDAAPEVVFDYVSDLRRHPEWAAQKLLMEETEPGRFDSIATLGPMKFKATTRIEASDRPRRLAYISDDGLAPHRWTFVIVPESGGSRVTFSLERMTDPWWAVVAQPLILFPLVGHPGMISGLASIKRNLEATQTEPAINEGAVG